LWFFRGGAGGLETKLDLLPTLRPRSPVRSRIDARAHY
jgi:hypothetical protein